MDRSPNSSSQVFDIIVLGAGPVGATLAWKFAADGYRVCLCDERRDAAIGPHSEHLPQQAVSLYRDLGMFKLLRPLLTPLDYTANFRNGRLKQITADEDYAISYQRLVEMLRQGVEKVACTRWEPVVRISAQGRVKSVRLQSGNVICAWMVVVAEAGERFRSLLEWREEVIEGGESTSFFWDMELADACRMRHPALVFRTSHAKHGYEHLRVFHRGDRVRANLFAFWGSGEERRRRIINGEVGAVLSANVEGLAEYLGPFRVVSGVEELPVTLSRIRGGAEAGIVQVGDAWGRVSPASELALCRGLHDAKLLASMTPEWLRERQLTPEVLKQYEVHPAKLAFDEKAYASSAEARKIATGRGPEWVARRMQGEFPEWLETACLRGVRGGQWTLVNVGLPAWRKGVGLVQSYRANGRRGRAGTESGDVLTAGHHDLSGADGLDDLVS